METSRRFRSLSRIPTVKLLHSIAIAWGVCLLPSLNSANAWLEPTYEYPPPVERDSALETIRVPAGYRVELVAAEPLTRDPVGFDWGPDGKLWVVEMADYPQGLDGRGKPGGRVRFLEDTDRDGVYDKSTLFLDGLAYPNGLMAWKNGVLLSYSPEIVFAEDTSGDGRCDRRTVLFTGFGGTNPQHLKSGFWWGLDNWVYGGGVQVPARVKIEATGEIVELGRRDFRLRPDEHRFDPQSGHTQHVRSRDDWGNWFGNNNSEPAFHFALADHYLRRNPHLRAPDPRVQISDTPGAAPVFPSSTPLKRFNDLNKLNRFTSACGLAIYRDTLLGEEFLGNTFVCEPVHNLVQREIVTPRGATFSSSRAASEQDSEFFSSTDPWSRPVMARTGPDGALWVADMYRLVIEHPEWIPDEWEKLFDLRAGEDKGRIYRVVPAAGELRPIPRTADLPTAALVELLESPNGTQRDMAHQMLIWRQDLSAVPLLERQLTASSRATARLHALCLLDGLKSLDEGHLRLGLADSDPGVVRHAIRLSESKFDQPELLAAAITAAERNPDPFVNMQLAYSLGESELPTAAAALGQLALRVGDDPLLRTAIISSANTHLAGLTRTVMAAESPPDAMISILMDQAVRQQNEPALLAILAHTAALEGSVTRAALRRLNVFFSGLESLGTNFEAFESAASPELKPALDGIRTAVDAAREIVSQTDAEQEMRLQAVVLLGRIPASREADLDQLQELLVPQSALELQRAAIQAMGRTGDPSVPERLLSAWKTAGPTLRSEMLDVLLLRPTWQREILNSLEQKTLSTLDLGAAQRQRLLTHRDENLRSKAQKLLEISRSSRSEVLNRYSAIETLAGDVTRGEKLFLKHCASCHRVGDQGTAVGPNLAALTDKSTSAMLVAILDPNRAVESRYRGYIAVTTDGRSFTGLLLTESGSSIELATAEGKRISLARNELEILKETGLSLMPEGLEKELAPQAMADLISFLRTTDPPPKKIAYNEPRIVEPEALRGEFWLVPGDAEVYGDTVYIEEKHRNLGYWQSENDRAVWTIQIRRAGTYTVSLEIACAPDAAGNVARLDVAGQTLEAVVPVPDPGTAIVV
jgi:putative membrane-bound dehydrogenase-like protein